MNPEPTTEESRRQGLIASARRTVAKIDGGLGTPIWTSNGVEAKVRAIVEIGDDITIEQIAALKASYPLAGPVYKSVVECNGCGFEVKRAVQVGEAPDYQSDTAVLCEQCLQGALDALRAAV